MMETRFALSILLLLLSVLTYRANGCGSITHGTVGLRALKHFDNQGSYNPLVISYEF